MTSARRLAPAVARLAAFCALLACVSARDEGAARRVDSLGARFPPFPAGIGAESRAHGDDAVLAILHVCQIHLPAGLVHEAPPPPDGREAIRARIRAANESQKAVHGLLLRLAGAGWDRVFAEGLSVEFPETDRLSLAMEYLGALRRIDEALGTRPPTLADRFVAHGLAGPPADPEWESFRYAPGAEVVLALSDEIRLLPAERRDLLRAADAALRDGGAAAAAAWSEEREDAILAAVAAAGDGAAVVLLGGAHDLGDNVARWNRSHPGRRISLAVLTPR